MEIKLRTVKGTPLTYQEMDTNLSSFPYTASIEKTTDSHQIVLFYTGSTELGLLPRAESLDITPFPYTGQATIQGSLTVTTQLTAQNIVRQGGTSSQFLKGDGSVDTTVYKPTFTENTAFNKDFGTTTGTVAEGDDPRILNGQTAFGWGNHALAGYALETELHNPVTIGTANGLSLNNQEISLALASTNTSGALSSTDWNTFNNKQNNLGFTPENTANKGQVNGYASLDGGGKVPAGQLPSFVDDVLEFADLASFPTTGETGKIYIAIDSNKTYRWTGSIYVEVSPSIGTDLSYNSTTRVLSSSTGTDVTLPLVTTTLDGLIASGDKVKLDGIANNANNYVHPNHTGDVTSSGDGATTISNNAVTTAKILDSNVTYSKIQNITGDRILGRLSTNGVTQELTAANVRSLINVADGANNFVHPAYTPISETLSGATVLATFSTDSIGSVTGFTTRTLTPADIGAAPSVAGGYLPLTLTSTQRIVELNGQFFEVYSSANTFTSGRLIVAPTYGAIGYQTNGVFRGLQILTDGTAVLSNTGTLTMTGALRIGTINNGAGDFITTDANGVLTKRTAAETLSDIGGVGIEGTLSPFIIPITNSNGTKLIDTNIGIANATNTIVGINGLAIDSRNTQPLVFRTNDLERWSILTNGTFQSNGAQTIQTSSGNLTLQSNGGNTVLGGALNVGGALNGTSANFSGDLTSNGELRVLNNTGLTFLQLNNTSSGGRSFTLISSGASNPHGIAAGNFYLRNSTLGTNPLFIDGNTGAATFSSSVTAQVNNILADGAGVVLQGYVDNTLRIAVRGSGSIGGGRGNLLANLGEFDVGITAVNIMSLGNDGSFGSNYKTLGLTGNTVGTHRIFAGISDDLFFAAATGRGFEFRAGGGNTASLYIASTGAATFSGALNGTSASFTGNVTAQGGYFFGVTQNSFVRLDNAVGAQIGYLNFADITLDSDGHRFFTGTGTSGSRTEKFFIANSGAATFSSSLQTGGNIRTLMTGTTDVPSIFAENNVGSLAQIRVFGTSASGTLFGVTRAGWSSIDTNNGLGLLFGTTENAPIVIGTNNTERLRITSGGALLVNTTNTTNTAAGKILQVLGGSSSPDLTLNGGAWSIASIGGEPSLYLSSNINTSGNNTSTQTAKGGIGFEYVNSSAPTDLILGIFGTPAVASSVKLFNGSERLRITSGGAMGLGLTPTNTAGRFEASNDIVAFASSDIRWKSNILNIDSALVKINKLNGVTFDWIEDEPIHGNKGHDYGVIAQEVEAMFPEMVQTRESGMKAVKYDRLIPVMIEAIKELKSEIDKLKDK